MKITRVDCFILDKQYSFVKVHTDEGVTGIGEIFRRNVGWGCRFAHLGLAASRGPGLPQWLRVGLEWIER